MVGIIKFATFNYGSQIVVVVKRECSKPAKNHQTLITNRLQETLVPAQNTQNNENIKIFWNWKASLLTLTNDLFVIMFTVVPQWQCISSFVFYIKHF